MKKEIIVKMAIIILKMRKDKTILNILTTRQKRKFIYVINQIVIIIQKNVALI